MKVAIFVSSVVALLAFSEANGQPEGAHKSPHFCGTRKRLTFGVWERLNKISRPGD